MYVVSYFDHQISHQIPFWLCQKRSRSWCGTSGSLVLSSQYKISNSTYSNRHDFWNVPCTIFAACQLMVVSTVPQDTGLHRNGTDSYSRCLSERGGLCCEVGAAGKCSVIDRLKRHWFTWLIGEAFGSVEITHTWSVLLLRYESGK